MPAPIRRTLAVTIAAFFPLVTSAQTPAKPGDVSASASIAGIAQFDTDLDQGGKFHWSGVVAAGSVTRQWTPDFSAGLTLRYDYQDWTFDSPRGVSRAPWNHLNAPTIGVNLNYAFAPDLSILVAPSFGWSYESGAGAGDAQTYGAALAAIKAFSPDLVLGLGASVFRRIDETKVFPFVVVNWKLDDRWRIANPFVAGPVGGAGLEAIYAPNDAWEFGAGGTYRSYRFRLADSGPIKNGIGENHFFPLFARVSRKFGPATHLDFYAALLVGGRLTVEDATGNETYTDNYKVAPAIGLSLAHRF